MQRGDSLAVTLRATPKGNTEGNAESNTERNSDRNSDRNVDFDVDRNIDGNIDGEVGGAHTGRFARARRSRRISAGDDHGTRTWRSATRRTDPILPGGHQVLRCPTSLKAMAVGS